MTEETATFENLLRLAEGLSLPKNDDEREVRWCEKKHILGISRQESGGIEIFLCGEEIKVSSLLIKRHMEFDEWTRAGGEIFRANRLVLPAEDYYIPAAAFLAEELLRKNIAGSLARGFAQTEPLIEMVLRRTVLSEDEILGLLGELRLLEAMLAVAHDSRTRARALDAWRGHESNARDFVVGSCSVEVKTTRGNRSRHKISNVMQVDPRRSESNAPQEELFLLSLGFHPVEPQHPGSAGFSLPEQVDSILQKLASPGQPDEMGELQILLLEKVARYGGEHILGYEHEEMRHWSAYQGRWQHGFIRIYDMADSAIRVLRRSEVQQCSHVVFESVSFDIDLPEKVSGDLNPHSDLFAMARKILSV